jgi:hypothetical protein
MNLSPPRRLGIDEATEEDRMRHEGQRIVDPETWTTS